MDQQGYILHCFSRYHQGQCLIYIIGRLQNGQTFGLVEDRFQPSFFIRVSEQERAVSVLTKNFLEAQKSAKTCMDGEPLVRVCHGDPHKLRRVADQLKDAKVRTYEADVKVELQFLMDRDLRSLCQIDGRSIKGMGVDRLYKNPKLTATDCVVSLKSVIIELFFDEDRLQSFAITSLPVGKASGETSKEQKKEKKISKEVKKNADGSGSEIHYDNSPEEEPQAEVPPPPGPPVDPTSAPGSQIAIGKKDIDNNEADAEKAVNIKLSGKKEKLNLKPKVTVKNDGTERK